MSTEVQVALYDLSMGMARNLSAQFLGPAHAVDMIPHTAILAFGQEYFFGQGIEWCAPHEFRQSRGIHPVEVKTLGRTARSRQEFEDWCRAQAANGRFGMQSYDFFHNNCNNFTETAAREGLGVNQGVDPWILELPQKFLQSPMGMIVRPMLESMQISNNAPTNVPSHHFASEPAAAPSASATTSAAAASNPWANIPASTPPGKHSTPDAPKTNLLEKQTALLSTDTKVVKVCVDKLKPEPEQTELLSKLADANATWAQEEISAVHQYLRAVIESAQNVSFALMLLRLVVLRQPADKTTATNEESTQLVASFILEEKLSSLANRSMAWCVLSNAVGSQQPPNWKGTEGHTLIQVIEKALSDCDPSKDGASSPSHVSLRQSAAAFLYNSSIYLTAATSSESGDMSDCMMSILLGCLEHLHEQTDVTTVKRMHMAVGQLLKSKTFGETAVELVKDLGLLDGEIATGKGHKEVEGLAREVAALLE